MNIKQRKALEARLAQIEVKLAMKGDIPRKNDVVHEAGVSTVLDPEKGKREDKDATSENNPGLALTQPVREQVAAPGGRQ